MQSTSTENPLVPIVIVFMFLLVVVAYVFYCYCLKRVVEKCGERPGAMIWIPILQMIPVFRIAKMDPLLILLLFVPVANLIIGVIVWIAVLKVLGRDPLMVIVLFLFGAFYLPYLALSSSVRRAEPQPA